MNLHGSMEKTCNHVSTFFTSLQLGEDILFLQVSIAVFGGSSNTQSFVAIRSVPLSWIDSVDLMQKLICRFVFDICGVPAVRNDRSFPAGSAGVVCMDGFDLVTRLKIVRDH